MKREPKIGFTQVIVDGVSAPGLIDLSTGTLAGPFWPEPGDQVVLIFEKSGGALVSAGVVDDRTGFASQIEAPMALRQYSGVDLSAIPLFIVIARQR